MERRVGIALGLLAALGWGASAFVTRFAILRAGIARTLFYRRSSARSASASISSPAARQIRCGAPDPLWRAATPGVWLWMRASGGSGERSARQRRL